MSVALEQWSLYNENFNTFQFQTLEALEITSAAEGHFEIPGTES